MGTADGILLGSEEVPDAADAVGRDVGPKLGCADGSDDSVDRGEMDGSFEG